MRSFVSNKSNGFLSVLLCLLSLFSPAICVPTYDVFNATIHTRSTLSSTNANLVYALPKRDETPWAEYENILKDAKAATLQAPTSSAKFLSFSKTEAVSISSLGFEGCSGIVIAGTEGAIVGHYTQPATSTAKALTEVEDLYNKHNTALTKALGWVYAELHPDNHSKLLNPAQVDAFSKLIERLLKAPPQLVYYFDVSSNPKSLNTPAWGLVLVNIAKGGLMSPTVRFVDAAWQDSILSMS